MAGIETLFDHNPTEEELQTLFGPISPKLNEAMRNGKNQDGAYLTIARLMGLRGDDAAMNRYLDKIESDSFRFEARMICSKLA